MEADRVEFEPASPDPEPESLDQDPASPDEGPASPDPESESPGAESFPPSPASNKSLPGPESPEPASLACQEMASAPDSPDQGTPEDRDDEGLISGSDNDEVPLKTISKDDVKNTNNETNGMEETKKSEPSEGEEGAIESEEGALESDSDSQALELESPLAPGGTPPGSLVVDTAATNSLKFSRTKSPKLLKERAEDKSPQKEVEAGKLRLAISRTSLQDDHLELDYDEEIEEADVGPNKKEEANDLEEGEMESSDISDLTSSDDGELNDEDCEEGEIKESSEGELSDNEVGEGDAGTQIDEMPQIGNCRFFMRGSCTWGMNCRFLHPGVNDKLIHERFIRMDSLRPSRMGPQDSWDPEISPPPMIEELPPPPPSESPRRETAWERGLRHAKELRKKASQRKQAETNFEEKRKNLTLTETGDDKDNNKENEHRRVPSSIVVKDPYYDQSYDDDYFDKQAQAAWHDGQYENFEVRWTRDPEYAGAFRPDKEKVHSGRERNYSPEPGRRFEKKERERYEKYERYERYEKFERPAKEDATRPPAGPPPPNKRGDEWQDPWQRVKPQKKADSRSPSRGRRKRRSFSRGSASSFSSDSYSSRSRSSSGSSYSSRSSYSRSSSYSSRSSRSRSRTPPPPRRMAAGLGRSLGATLLAGRGKVQGSRPAASQGRGAIGAAVSTTRPGTGVGPGMGRGRPGGPQQATKLASQGPHKVGSQLKPSPAGRATASGPRGGTGKGGDKAPGPGKLAFQVKTTKKLTGPVKPLAAQSDPESEEEVEPSKAAREQKPGVFNKPSRSGQPSQDKSIPSAPEKRSVPEKTLPQPEKKTAPRDPFLAVLEKKAQAQEKAAAILASKKTPASDKRPPASDKKVPAADKKLSDKKPTAPDKKPVPADSKVGKAGPEAKKTHTLAQEKKGKPSVDSKTAGSKAPISKDKRRGISDLPMPPGHRPGRTYSSGSSRSRSRSSDSHSSISSISSTESSGSADSEHLYRNIGSSQESKKKKDLSKRQKDKLSSSSKDTKHDSGLRDARKPPAPARPDPSRPSRSDARQPGHRQEARQPTAGRQELRLPGQGRPETSRSTAQSRPELSRSAVQGRPEPSRAAVQGRLEPSRSAGQGRSSRRTPPRQDSRASGGRPDRQEASMPRGRDGTRQDLRGESRGDARENRGGNRGSGRDGDIRGPSRPDSGRVSGRPEGESRIRSIVSTSAPAATKQSKESKDLLKMAGQKSSIKLTLKSDKAGGYTSSAPNAPGGSGSKKRPLPEADGAPPSKKPMKSPTKEPSRAPPRQEKPTKPSSPRGKPEVAPQKSPVKAAPPKAAQAAAASRKKSTSTRREELLKQLKAVEDAIARKRAKLP